MRVIHRDMKTGEIKLLVETEDDLWHLYNIIEKGDRASALTYRREEAASDKLRAERGEKKRMRLRLMVESVEFHEFSEWLRVHGIIEQGPQDMGQHHTFNLTVGETITIIKDWRKEHLDRLKDAERSAARPLITFLAIDEDEAVLAQLREYGMKEVAKIASNTSGKQYACKKDGKKEFYKEVLDKVEQISGDGEVIIVGPGFEKENITAWARENNLQITSKFHLLASGQSGMAAIQEVMKKGVGTNILTDSRVATETKLVETLLAEIGKNGLYAYGPDELGAALDAGAIETLLITDHEMRNRGFESLLQKAEETQARIVVISTLHDAGKKLASLGGIGAILRYRA